MTLSGRNQLTGRRAHIAKGVSGWLLRAGPPLLRAPDMGTGAWDARAGQGASAKLLEEALSGHAAHGEGALCRGPALQSVRSACAAAARGGPDLAHCRVGCDPAHSAALRGPAVACSWSARGGWKAEAWSSLREAAAPLQIPAAQGQAMRPSHPRQIGHAGGWRSASR